MGEEVVTLVKLRIFRPESYPEEGEVPCCVRHGDGGTEAGWERMVEVVRMCDRSFFSFLSPWVSGHLDQAPSFSTTYFPWHLGIHRSQMDI